MAISKQSKSATKRESTALQQLGEELIALTEVQLGSIGLDDDLLEAVLGAKSMKSRGALRRQKQLIGKLMRRQDPSVVRDAIQKHVRNDQLQKAVFRRAEEWRDRIAAEGSGALQEYFTTVEQENDTVSELCRMLDLAHDDRKKRDLRRKLFRVIYGELSLKVQDGSL